VQLIQQTNKEFFLISLKIKRTKKAAPKSGF